MSTDVKARYSKKTEYLNFKGVMHHGKATFRIGVYNFQEETLGLIYWRNTWRRYVFAALGNIDFDSKCLADITKVLDELMEERKK